jgi:hypothetical protein
MANNKLKIIMTDLAAGHISKKEAEDLIEEEKMHQNEPMQEIEGNPKKDDTHKRKKQVNVKEVK